MSRNGIRISLLATLFVGALFWVSPYWAVAGMAKAAKAADAELLSDYIDIARLKESLKGQAMAAMQSEMKTATSGWAVLGMALGTVMIDKIIDNGLTPEVLANQLSQHLPDMNASRATLAMRLIGSHKTGWVNSSTFRIQISDDSTMTWRRQGLAWRLTSLKMPLSKEQ